MKGFGMKVFSFFRFLWRVSTVFVLLAPALAGRAQSNSGGPVGPPIQPFTVTITSPISGTTFPAWAGITISATALDYTAFIDNMAFYAGSNLLQERVIDPIGVMPTNGDKVILPYDWTNVPPGTYTLTAVARDTKGQSVTSAPVYITVGSTPPPPMPIVSIIATDPIAVEPGTNTNHIVYPLVPTPFRKYCSGTNTATFLVRRIYPAVYAGANSDLTVFYNISGTASNGVDYVTLPGYVTIPAGKNFALITVVPLEDKDPAGTRPFSTVVLSLTYPPTMNPVPGPYKIGWPDKAAAIILEEYLYPFGPPIGPIVGGTPPSTLFHVCQPATNGMSYCIQVSSNLVDWIPVCTKTVVKGSIQFLDPDAGSLSNRYYRTIPVAVAPVY